MPFASLKNIQKSNQRVHKERPQPKGREHLGILPKKQDFKKRAVEHEKKQKTIVALKRQAQDKNANEFYFSMINSKTDDGVHHAVPKVKAYTDEELAGLMTQDIAYLRNKLVSEQAKITRLQSGLHLIGGDRPVQHTHTLFVSTRRQKHRLDPAKRLNTHPAFLDRAFNRPRMDQLSQQLVAKETMETVARVAKETERSYRELGERQNRLEKLQLAVSKMEAKSYIMKNKGIRMKEMTKETKSQAPIYKFEFKRKR